MDGALYNSDGKIYIRYHEPIPKAVTIAGNFYVCEVRRGVSMLTVTEQEALPLLEYLGGCCGGRKKVFSLASQGAVNLWERGER